MRPEIADLIVGPFYEQLQHDEEVLKYPQINGITKNLFFVNHSQLGNNVSKISVFHPKYGLNYAEIIF